MPLYLFALTDVAFAARRIRGRRIGSVRLAPRLYALCETRVSAPPVADGELRWQHAFVVDAWKRASAMLPVRFGTLIEREELEALARAHRGDFTQALDHVRGRCQMTLRFIGVPAPPPAAAPPARSGREYLARRRARPALSPAAAALLDRLAPLVADERREPGAGQLLATVYHLVSKRHAAKYRRTTSVPPVPGVVLSGPWPPFAFAPRLS